MVNFKLNVAGSAVGWTGARLWRMGAKCTVWGVGILQPEPGLLGFRDERCAVGMTGQQKRKP